MIRILATNRAGMGQLLGYAVSKLAPGLIALATVPLWMRFFGESAYAGWSLVWVVSNFGSAVAIGWLRQSILRFSGDSSMSSTEPPRLLNMGSVVVGTVPLVVLLLINFSQVSDWPMLLVSSVAFAILNGCYLIAQARAQSQRRVGAYSLAEVLRSAVALGGSLLLGVALGIEPLVSMVTSYAISTILAYAILRERSAKRPSRAASRAGLFWRYGWPMSIWLALSQILVYFDRLILAPHISADALGTYAATSDLVVRGIGMIAFPITMFAHPIVMSKWNQGDQKGALHTNARALLWIAALTGVCVVALLVAGRPLLSVVLGGAVPQTSVIVCLAIGAALWQIALQAHKPLEMLNRTGLMTIGLGATCVATLVALFLLTPLYGQAAASAVFATGAALYVATSTIVGRRVWSRTQKEAVLD